MTADAFADLTEDLLALYRSQSKVTVDSVHSRSMILAHGWYQRCRRTAQALLLLSGQGYGNEAAPLRRCLIEHAAFLHWLADAPDGAVNSVLWKHQKRIAQMREAMNGS